MQVSASTPSMYSQELFQLSQYLQVWSNADLYWPSKDTKSPNAKILQVEICLFSEPYNGL